MATVCWSALFLGRALERSTGTTRAREVAARMLRGGAIERRLAAAPISWGVCEVPGWGRQLPSERVLSELASLGLRATELGPLGYLGDDVTAVRSALARHGL